jgi:hypothetical protein
MVYEEHMDADVWIRFLDRLVRSEAKARKIFLILDRHSVFRPQIAQSQILACEK